MVQSTPQTMKKLTRIKLVNWHYFGNETIDVNGSFLLSGENASGKSTILDAIQLILTTNTRRFNPAANEKSKRDLKGYVRCKTGEEGNTYARKNSVISYVALEFYEESKDDLKTIIINLERDIEDLNSLTNKLKAQVSELEAQVQKLSDGDNNAILAAEQKYAEHSKTKEAGTIYDNYGRRKAVLDNQHGKLLRELISMQASYKEGEYGTGEEVVFAYAQEYRTLSNHNLIEYEEKLNKAKEDCELEFRENFLARMRENIESAQDIFKNLNKALKNIYYGNDSYKFHYSAHSRKQGLYEMITSEVNMGGFTLFASEFEERYHSEMEDLFSKLTESDEHGDKILSEYTDYREYMDYDIEIVSKDGKSQYFSKIYGEKSGGETQTPYYVAIAASFAQMYSVGETIRIIMLDEAFDKMDDDRIENMMKFLRSQNFQIILATPPAKIETIGEYVDTVLVTYRNGYSSIVEEYDL